MGEDLVRQANIEDIEAFCEILCASIRDLCAADHGDDPEAIARWTANKTPEHVAGWIVDPRLTPLLAVRNGEPAGVGCIGEDGEVLLNYVGPAHRFSGVSRMLLTHMEEMLAVRGVGIGRLTSTETAHRFYREAAWVDSGEPEILFGLKGYPMTKDLTARFRPDER